MYLIAGIEFNGWVFDQVMILSILVRLWTRAFQFAVTDNAHCPCDISLPARTQLTAREFYADKGYSLLGRSIVGPAISVIFAVVLTLPASSTHAQEAKREPDPPKEVETTVEKPDARTILKALQARANVTAEKTPLKDVVAQLAKEHDVSIILDVESFKKAGITVNIPVTATIKNFTLNAALRHILKDLKLHHSVKDGAVVIAAGPPPEAEIAAGEAAADEAPAPRRAAVAAMVGPAVAVGQQEQLEAQALTQMRPILRAQLHFVRKVCQPTKAEMKLIEDDAEAILKEAAKKHAVFQQRQMQGQQQAGNNSSPQKLLRDSFAKSVKTHLSPDQAARFQDEVDRQAADRRKAVVRKLVARLDRDLVLSAEQREKIFESLVFHWQDAWCPQLEVFMYGDQFFPNIPDKHVSVFLNETQRKVWRARQQNQGNIFFGGMNVMGGLLGESLPWEDDADEKKNDE